MNDRPARSESIQPQNLYAALRPLVGRAWHVGVYCISEDCAAPVAGDFQPRHVAVKCILAPQPLRTVSRRGRGEEGPARVPLPDVENDAEASDDASREDEDEDAANTLYNSLGLDSLEEWELESEATVDMADPLPSVPPGAVTSCAKTPTIALV